MITTKLKLKVIDEATKLKTCATKKELARLNFKRLRPEVREECIYGQMTGNCFSERATELLNCCAVPYSAEIESLVKTRVKSFNDKNRTNAIAFMNINWVFSPIEFYIVRTGAKNRNLINYLKGIKETLTTEDL